VRPGFTNGAFWWGGGCKKKWFAAIDHNREKGRAVGGGQGKGHAPDNSTKKLKIVREPISERCTQYVQFSTKNGQTKERQASGTEEHEGGKDCGLSAVADSIFMGGPKEEN